MKENFQPYMINFIKSYLQQRTFKIKKDGTTTGEFIIEEGLPQGSAISLFNIFTNDIPTDTRTKTALFADDLAIFTTSKQKTTIKRRLENHLRKITNYYKKWRLNVHKEKTVEHKH